MSRPVPKERRHTLAFLREIRAMSPVFLDTEVDMTAVREHRGAAKELGRAYSVVSYVMRAAGEVLAKHPDANSAVRGGIRPRTTSYDAVHGKLTLDRMLNGRRVVLAALVRDLQTASLEEIQRQVEYYRDGDPARLPEFAGVLALQRLPWPLRQRAYRHAVRPLDKRADKLGTFAITSLGHRTVDGFHSVGGTTITLGVGRIMDRPVARDGAVVVAPVMRLSLAFDHRVIDGAEAADVLAEVTSALERPVDGTP